MERANCIACSYGARKCGQCIYGWSPNARGTCVRVRLPAASSVTDKGSAVWVCPPLLAVTAVPGQAAWSPRHPMQRMTCLSPCMIPCMSPLPALLQCPPNCASCDTSRSCTNCARTYRLNRRGDCVKCKVRRGACVVRSAFRCGSPGAAAAGRHAGGLLLPAPAHCCTAALVEDVGWHPPLLGGALGRRRRQTRCVAAVRRPQLCRCVWRRCRTAAGATTTPRAAPVSAGWLSS